MRVKQAGMFGTRFYRIADLCRKVGKRMDVALTTAPMYKGSLDFHRYHRLQARHSQLVALLTEANSK